MRGIKLSWGLKDTWDMGIYKKSTGDFVGTGMPIEGRSQERHAGP